MPMYGCIRTSRDLESDRSGTNPEAQRQDPPEVGVQERYIYANIDVSGVAGVTTRNAWRLVDTKLGHSHVLVLTALDRIRRLSLGPPG